MVVSRDHPTDVESRDPPTAKSIDSKPINATWARRYATLLAVTLLECLPPRHKVSVLVLTRGLCVKYGDEVDLCEASTMNMIAQKTSIPVPKIYCAFDQGETTYIVMEHIRGDTLGSGWLSRSEESKAKILSQLKGYIREMRKLPPPGLGVANVDGGSLFDPRIPVKTGRFGPFTTVQAFHEFLHDGLSGLPDQEGSDLIKKHNGPWPPPVFTHGDLSSLNILADGDIIIGIVDWETAGWFPSYWEYTTARQPNPWKATWTHEIDKFLDPYEEEQAMEEVRQKYFGQFGVHPSVFEEC